MPGTPQSARPPGLSQVGAPEQPCLGSRGVLPDGAELSSRTDPGVLVTRLARGSRGVREDALAGTSCAMPAPPRGPPYGAGMQCTGSGAGGQP